MASEEEMSHRVVYVNGQFVPEADAKISIYDLSVMQAAAAFEMTRSFNGRHFKLREHFERLKESCRLLHIPFPTTVGELFSICETMTRKNNHGPGEEHRLLIVVSPGCAPMYKELDGVIPHPFVYIADFPLRYTVQGFGKYFTEGVRCVTSHISQVPNLCVPAQAKHRSRLHFHLAQQKAVANTWPLLLDGDGCYTEAPGANLVYVEDGRVYTISENALEGISLATVRELCETVNGARWTLCDVDELWLTGTPFCMLPVVELDGKPIGDGTPGPIYRQTLQKWNELVGLNIAQQIQEWDRAARP